MENKKKKEKRKKKKEKRKDLRKQKKATFVPFACVSIPIGTQIGTKAQVKVERKRE